MKRVKEEAHLIKELYNESWERMGFFSNDR